MPEGSDGVAAGGLVATSAGSAVVLGFSGPLPVWVMFAVLGVVGLLWWLESHE